MKNNPLSDPKHPIWNILQHAVWLGAIVGFLYLNATKFDSTEIETIIEAVGVVIVAGVAKKLLVKDKAQGAE
jgi:hypothetical protein